MLSFLVLCLLVPHQGSCLDLLDGLQHFADPLLISSCLRHEKRPLVFYKLNIYTYILLFFFIMLFYFIFSCFLQDPIFQPTKLLLVQCPCLSCLIEGTMQIKLRLNMYTLFKQCSGSCFSWKWPLLAAAYHTRQKIIHNSVKTDVLIK